MKIVHRFYDLFIGGAEVVVLNTVKALREHQHILLFSRSNRNWISDELSKLKNAVLVQLEPGTEVRTICSHNADLHCFHYYPPMDEADFRDLPPRVLNTSLLVNHWYKDVPAVPGLRYLFLSEESRVRTGASIPSKFSRVLLNPVADKFFTIRREEVPCSVGRHSRDALFKFPTDFFDVTEAIKPGQLDVMVLGAPAAIQQFVASNLSQLKNNYWLLPFGSLSVPAFLRRPQIYLYQTRNDFAETCPMNILEAMAAGIPVVAERKGGIASLIESGQTGFLCESQPDYIEACLRLLDDQSLRRQISVAAQQSVRERASMAGFENRYLRCIEELFSS